MEVLTKLIETYKQNDTQNTLDYNNLIDELNSSDKFKLMEEIKGFNEGDVQSLTSFFRDTLHIELSQEFVSDFLKENPILACMIKDGSINETFEEDYVRSLFCFYIGIQPWPLAVFGAEQKEAFFKALIERSMTMNFSFVKQVQA